MNLAVKLYSTMPADNENVLAGIDGKIPAEIRFDVDTVPDETYQLMTQKQYDNYLISIQPELEIWKEIQKSLPIIEGEF
jgi:hypothetical protein